jgi:hypothetical protein
MFHSHRLFSKTFLVEPELYSTIVGAGSNAGEFRNQLCAKNASELPESVTMADSKSS